MNPTSVTSYGSDLPANQSPVRELESGVLQDEFVMGQWEVELKDWRRLDRTRGCMACFCPFVTYAQISARLFPNNTFWWIALSNFVLQATAVVWAVLAIKAVFDGEEFYITIVYAYVAAIYYVYIVRDNVATLRDCVRDRFKIPGSSAEDKHDTLWYFPCVLAQMATQVKSSKAGSCSFTKPDAIPAYVH